MTTIPHAKTRRRQDGRVSFAPLRLCVVLLPLLLSLLLVFLADATLGQVPPLPPSLPPLTNYYAVVSVLNSVTSAPSNEVQVTNNMVLLVWTNSTTPGASNVVLRGHASGKYTMRYAAGTNNSMALPLPPLPFTPPVFVLQTSTDLLHWSDALAYTGSVSEPARWFKIVRRTANPH